MQETRAIERYEEAATLLPPRFRRAAKALDDHRKLRTEEFRLRTLHPPTALLPEGEIALPYFGAQPCVTSQELRDMVDALTDYSHYACTETLRRGFLSLHGGFRLGICGTAIVRDGAVTGLRDISSLALRIVTERVGIADTLTPQLFGAHGFESTLILSPPGGGKTTLLRDLIRTLSDGDRQRAALRVAVVDERGELAVSDRGEMQMTLGTHTDVLTLCPKHIGIELLLRAMDPQIIAVDEVATREDTDALIRAANCGARILATMHAADTDELRRKPLWKALRAAAVFRFAVVLTGTGSDRRVRVEEIAK